MTTMTERQTISLSAGSWLVGRLLEYRAALALPALDLDKPFLVAMPTDTDGALITSRHGTYTLANMHAGPTLDLPVDDGGAFEPVRVGTQITPCATRRHVAVADCHDTAALLIEASGLMNETGRISSDTHASTIEAATRMTRPYAEIFAGA